MGSSDQDWYREDHRDARPVIELRIRRYTWVRWAGPAALVTLLLAGVAYQGLRMTPAVPPPTSRPADQSKPESPPTADAVAFPKDGFTMVSRHPGADWDSPLTLRMPSDTAYRHWIVSVRDWATGKWVATVFRRDQDQQAHGPESGPELCGEVRRRAKATLQQVAASPNQRCGDICDWTSCAVE